MIVQYHKFALTAVFGLALAFTFSCTSVDDGDDGGSSNNSSGGASGPCPNAVTSDGFVSCGGQTYRTVQIGDQVWMAENLNYNVSGSKCYGEGGQVYDKESRTLITLSTAEIQANCDKYGRLYNWATAKTVCPSGWHLPSDVDWNTLIKFVNPSCNNNPDCDYTGAKLKATSGWKGNGNGTDDAYEFAALPGGEGNSAEQVFEQGGDIGYWWSASEYDSFNAKLMTIERVVSSYDYRDKTKLFSVRCVKD